MSELKHLKKEWKAIFSCIGFGIYPNRGNVYKININPARDAEIVVLLFDLLLADI
ncbi:MAG: hypothetical protein ACFFA6_07680 [Promethearchaeota archaeon]